MKQPSDVDLNSYHTSFVSSSFYTRYPRTDYHNHIIPTITMSPSLLALLLHYEVRSRNQPQPYFKTDKVKLDQVISHGTSARKSAKCCYCCCSARRYRSWSGFVSVMETKVCSIIFYFLVFPISEYPVFPLTYGREVSMRTGRE